MASGGWSSDSRFSARLFWLWGVFSDILFLVAQAGDLRARYKRLLREWGQTKEDRQEGAEQRRREDVKNEILHVDKEWLALLGERLELLSHEPIDAGEFHSTLTGLLTEKIRLLEFVKLGPEESESPSSAA